MLWLGEERGYLTDWITQEWVCLSGRRVELANDVWLTGLIGKTTQIGKTYFSEFASASGLEIQRGDIGLIQNFDDLAWEEVDISHVQSGVRHFYEHTSAYDLDAWSQWSGIFRPFGGLLAALFSRRLQQLNVPLSGLDTSQGITSDVIQLVDPQTGRAHYTAWVRELIGTKNVLFAGSYSLCKVPGYAGMCVKVVFPLPNGNAMVLMKPIVHEDGSLTVSSSGERFGDPGFYFTVHRNEGVYAHYVPAMREYIHVYEASTGQVRADHVLSLWRQTFLRLHYRLRFKDQMRRAA